MNPVITYRVKVRSKTETRQLDWILLDAWTHHQWRTIAGRIESVEKITRTVEGVTVETLEIPDGKG